MAKRLWMAVLGVLLAVTVQAAPRVVVTIKPVHALVAGVMQGVGIPELLLEGANSPHGYSLRPSEARSMSRADLIVWVGPALETFMVKSLEAHGQKARILELMGAPGMQLLPAREGGAWEGHEHHVPHDHYAASMDAHLWLSPDNAAATVRQVAALLAELDPAGAVAYRANEQRLLQRIAALETELKAQLAPVRGVPYVVFHDAYQYFEHAFGVNAVGAISVNPEHRPGAKGLQQIRARLKELGVAAVFAEPQFEPKLVRTVVEGSGARVGILDPIGADLVAGEEAWFQLLRELAATLRSTLGGD